MINQDMEFSGGNVAVAPYRSVHAINCEIRNNLLSRLHFCESVVPGMGTP
jgi:hypothetical protein